MNNKTKIPVKSILCNLCCSICKNDFDENSIKILEEYTDTFLCELSCTHCGKIFGKIILNYNSKEKYHPPLEVVEGPDPISADDVLDAHLFIKNNL